MDLSRKKEFQPPEGETATKKGELSGPYRKSGGGVVKKN